MFYPTECPYSPLRPCFRKEEALENSLSDPALLHASLAHVAAALDSLAGIDLSPNAVYHVGQAIVIVNKRLANSLHEAVTNKTICAVAALFTFEVRVLTASTISFLIANTTMLLAQSWLYDEC
jgi:hypothetical protein